MYRGCPARGGVFGTMRIPKRTRPGAKEAFRRERSVCTFRSVMHGRPMETAVLCRGPEWRCSILLSTPRPLSSTHEATRPKRMPRKKTTRLPTPQDNREQETQAQHQPKITKQQKVTSLRITHSSRHLPFPIYLVCTNHTQQGLPKTKTPAKT